MGSRRCAPRLTPRQPETKWVRLRIAGGVVRYTENRHLPPRLSPPTFVPEREHNSRGSAQPSDFRSRTGTQLPGLGSALRLSFPNGNTTAGARLSPPTFVPERERNSRGSAQPSDFRSRTLTEASHDPARPPARAEAARTPPPARAKPRTGGRLPLSPSPSMPNPEVGREHLGGRARSARGPSSNLACYGPLHPLASPALSVQPLQIRLGQAEAAAVPGAELAVDEADLGVGEDGAQLVGVGVLEGEGL